ncbi:uncharacterized protein LOC126158266 [Schistocerca cancellata]|uniref:uncharacterized protein LOC126158266 n=1 Tax=Schistocerca cancellata TaxID=274614 RepID=UPI0021193558|nr:uncharacterized protein LOC126158266 [Schistocerca cancellata]
MSTLAYHKEVLFYGDFLRKVKKHLRCAAPEAASTCLGTVPRCYYLRLDLLVLEDLSLAGFRMPDPLVPLSLPQAECVLKALARLHAASLVFEEREGRRLADAYPLLLEETLFRKEPGFPPYAAQVSCVQIAHVLLDLVPRFGRGTPHNEQLHSHLEPAMQEIYKFLKPSDKYRNVLCHRDLWVNNMLFAEDAKGELSVRLVDFQTLHLEPPAHDVMIFMHWGMLRDLRRACGQGLLELYHHTLADVLRQHDLDIDSVLPLQVFMQSCVETQPLAVILAVYTLQATTLPIKTTVFEEMAALVREMYRRDERFRRRLTEAMEELVETCLMPRLAYHHHHHHHQQQQQQQQEQPPSKNEREQ